MEGKSFEEYFKKKLLTDKEIIKNLPYTIEELREIYRQEFDYKNSAPPLELKLEAQDIDYDTASFYLPEKWEMTRNGRLHADDEELLNVLKLLLYNVGLRRALDSIPQKLIEEYLQERD
ncbi:hypothetical protein M3181_22030 [Mesobacillus maritimus]|uniref:hypothetical protein n=1 Tax=Mesobacillus maritimus TaxID=1643336 RepID=UPI00203C05D4|nr:hypothetical protein [Mesobacillus maritimus]MCM3671639.1 hypothetical protein [Mesobacillus maritimus]